MAFSYLGRMAVIGAATFGLVTVVACDHNGWDDGYGYHHHGQQQCSNVVQQCRTVCDYYCDSFQCYPVCGDECVDVCADSSSGDDDDFTDASTISSDGGAIVTDASPPPATTGDAGTGVLCTSCVSNSDCEEGALCILRGGTRDAGDTSARGFCGAACTTTVDCPDGFLCSQIGSTRQCLPTGNACQ